MDQALIETVGHWWPLLALLTIVLGVGRMARLVTHDAFPPAAAVRQWWTARTAKHYDWTILFFCFWCLTPWIMAVALGWFALTFVHVAFAWAWWIFWGWLALSYVASMVVARDEPADG